MSYKTLIETVIADGDSVDYVIVIPPELILKANWDLNSDLKCYVEEIKTTGTSTKKEMRLVIKNEQSD